MRFGFGRIRSLSRDRRSACFAFAFLLPFLVLAGANSVVSPRTASAASGPTQPSQSSPIALGTNGPMLVNVNPTANTITVFLALPHGLKKQSEIPVGREPSSIAMQPQSQTAYVANALDGTVSILTIPSRNIHKTLTVGAEPRALALSPNGTRLYMANSTSNSLTVIDTKREEIVTTVDLSPFGTAPRAIAVTNDGDSNDNDETAYVALFFSELRPGK